MQSGAEIKNHMRTSAIMVPKGTAPDERVPIKKKFRMTKTTKMMLREKSSQILPDSPRCQLK
jgi:hypothetical protein